MNLLPLELVAIEIIIIVVITIKVIVNTTYYLHCSSTVSVKKIYISNFFSASTNQLICFKEINISQSNSNNACKYGQSHTVSYIKSKSEALTDIDIWSKTSFKCQVFADLVIKGSIEFIGFNFLLGKQF